LHFALLTDNFSPINDIKISFDAEVYKKALDILEKQIPIDEKKNIHTYITYFKTRLDIVDM
jgi:hypothetical protein